MRTRDSPSIAARLSACGLPYHLRYHTVHRELRTSTDYVTRPPTAEGRTKRLYAAVRDEDADKPFMAHLLRLAREIPVRLQRGEASSAAR